MKKRIFILLLCTSFILTSGCSNVAINSSNVSQEQNKDTENTDGDTENNDNNMDADTENNDNNMNADTENNDNNMDVDTENNDNANIETTDNPENTDIEHNTDNLSTSLYSVTSQHYRDSVLSEDDKQELLMESSYDVLEIQGEGYDALKTAVAQWQKESQDSLQTYIKDNTEFAKEHLAQVEDFYGYSVSQTYQIMRSDTQILSILEDYYEYTGGAHPSYYKDGINFDAVTGKRLSLEDITTDFEAFRQQALSYILDYLKNSDIGQEGGFFDNYEDAVAETFSDTPWYFTAAGITLVYNPYAIAPYAAGDIHVTLPASEFTSLLKEEYLTCSGIGYASVPKDTLITYTVGASDAAHTILITNETTADENGYEDNIPYITLDDVKTPVAEWSSWLLNCYLIRQANGRTLLAFENSFMSDDYETFLYDISNGTLEKVDSAYAAISAAGTNTLTLSTHLYVLGTYTGYRTYDISGDSIQPLEEEYYIPSAYSNITTIRELPVTDASGANVLLPVGTTLKPIATDEKSYLKAKDIATDKEYTIYFTKEDYQIIIDGVDEYEYFEMLPYAG